MTFIEILYNKRILQIQLYLYLPLLIAVSQGGFCLGNQYLLDLKYVSALFCLICRDLAYLSYGQLPGCLQFQNCQSSYCSSISGGQTHMNYICKIQFMNIMQCLKPLILSWNGCKRKEENFLCYLLLFYLCLHCRKQF